MYCVCVLSFSILQPNQPPSWIKSTFKLKFCLLNLLWRQDHAVHSLVIQFDNFVMRDGRDVRLKRFASKRVNSVVDNHRTMQRCAPVKMNDILHFLVRDKMITVWREREGGCYWRLYTRPDNHMTIWQFTCDPRDHWCWIISRMSTIKLIFKSYNSSSLRVCVSL